MIVDQQLQHLKHNLALRIIFKKLNIWFLDTTNLLPSKGWAWEVQMQEESPEGKGQMWFFDGKGHLRNRSIPNKVLEAVIDFGPCSIHPDHCSSNLTKTQNECERPYIEYGMNE